MYFTFPMNFMFFKNEIKVFLKFYKKIIFLIWSLYTMKCKINDSVEIYSNYLILFICNFYFIYQIHTFCTISIFIMNAKNNFCILLFNEFYVFGKWNKSSFKNLQKKIIFTIWSLYVMICEMYEYVEFYSNYRMYLVINFILYIKFVQYVWFRYLS